MNRIVMVVPVMIFYENLPGGLLVHNAGILESSSPLLYRVARRHFTDTID